MKIYSELVEAQKNIYIPSGLIVTNVIIEKESEEYSACEFMINNKRAKFRVANITPTKIGQFVTFWKRSVEGPIAPFDISDSIDFFIIHVQCHDQVGQFIFPKSVLLQQDIISKNNVGGKRGFRVYPSWDKAENKQAIKTQLWQLRYFVEFKKECIDAARIKHLFSV